MQSFVDDPSKKIDIEQELQKKEYINLANSVLKKMAKDQEKIKDSFKKKPLISPEFRKKWIGRITLYLVAGSFLYWEVWPRVRKNFK